MKSFNPSKNRKFTRITGLFIAGITLFSSCNSFIDKEKKSEREKPARIETITLKKETLQLPIIAYGKVQPHRNLSVLSEVKGKVIEQSPDLDAGGILKEGEIFLKLDPRDYVVDVEQNRAKVEKAEFELVQEKGKKLIAEKEWQLLDSSLKQGGLGKDLALRIPHLREKEAALHAAQSSLEKSLVDLKRTIFRAPFNALVLEEFVEKGQLILPHTKIATLVSIDEFRIKVSIPFNQLAFLNLPKDKSPGMPVSVIRELGDGKELKREGSILRLLGGMDPNGRLVELLVVVKDPLNLEEGTKETMPLLLGSDVKIVFDGPETKGVAKIPVKALREENKIWIKSTKGTLEVRPVTVVAADKNTVYITGDAVKDGEEVITSSLPVAVEGMTLN